MKTQTLMKSTTNHYSKHPLTCLKKDGYTKQSHKKECDINQIMAKYQRTGVIDHVNKHSENYGFATSEDLHESLNIINTANEMFADLPSKARTKFKNDPGQFLEFVQDPENADQLYDLGLSDFQNTESLDSKTQLNTKDSKSAEPATAE